MEEKLINLTIDNKSVKVPKGTSILQAARQAGIDIPTLCFLKEINEVGDCRMCIVEVERKTWLYNILYYKGRRRNGGTYEYAGLSRVKKSSTRPNSFKPQNRLLNLYSFRKLRITSFSKKI